MGLQMERVTGSVERVIPSPEAVEAAVDWLETFETPLHFFDDREFAQLGVDFANERDTRKQMRRLVELCNGHQITDRIVIAADALPSFEEATRGWQTWITERLVRVLGNRTAGRLALAKEVMGAGDKVLIKPLTRIEGGKLRTVYRWVSLGPKSALGRVLVLLCDPESTHGDDLRRCQWDPCGKFFFLQRTTGGAPMRGYCCAEHRDEGTRLDTRKRVQRLRRKQARTNPAPRRHK
jgi:hypothetical protein